MRLIPALCAALVATVLAVPAAAAFPLSAGYSGTEKGGAVVRVTGLKKQAAKINNPGTLLLLDSTALTYSFGADASALHGTMTQLKPGKFAIVPPAGQDLADFVVNAQAYIDGSSFAVLNLTSAGIKGSHLVKGDFASVTSKISISAKALTAAAANGLKTKIKAKLTYSGQASF